MEKYLNPQMQAYMKKLLIGYELNTWSRGITWSKIKICQLSQELTSWLGFSFIKNWERIVCEL
jgi:hypothetical protein